MLFVLGCREFIASRKMGDFTNADVTYSLPLIAVTASLAEQFEFARLYSEIRKPAFESWDDPS